MVADLIHRDASHVVHAYSISGCSIWPWSGRDWLWWVYVKWVSASRKIGRCELLSVVVKYTNAALWLSSRREFQLHIQWLTKVLSKIHTVSRYQCSTTMICFSSPYGLAQFRKNLDRLSALKKWTASWPTSNWAVWFTYLTFDHQLKNTIGSLDSQSHRPDSPEGKNVQIVTPRFMLSKIYTNCTVYVPQIRCNVCFGGVLSKLPYGRVTRDQWRRPPINSPLQVPQIGLIKYKHFYWTLTSQICRN